MQTGTTVQKLDFYPLDAILRDLVIAWGYDANNLHDAEKTEIGKNIARFMGKQEPYGRSYITNILAGRCDSKPIRAALMALLAVADGARVEQVRTHPVECLTEFNVHPGALILIDSRLCRCGLHFIPRAWNQRWHSKDCPARKDGKK
jgi:hypothetical protein